MRPTFDLLDSVRARVTESLHVGVAGLGAHKLRSMLATLGVVFGVAAVIAMLAVGEGAKREALAKYEAWGSDNIIIRDLGEDSEDRRGEGAAFSRGLSRRDADAVSSVIPTAVAVVPQTDRKARVLAADEEAECLLVATTPDLLQVITTPLAHGRFLHEMDGERTSSVCVLGGGVARDLFPIRSPLGKRVKVERDWFTVVGVMRSTPRIAESAGVLQARDLNRDIYVPLDTDLARRRIVAPVAELTQITVKVAPKETLRPTAVTLRRLLERRHMGAADFGLVVPEELMAQQQKEQRMFNIVLGAIAAISLLVGGIGIMNIMLASVLERRREIGIRRALGARRADILGQFVAEASTISLAGGLLGIALGLLLAGSIHLITQFRASPTIPAVALAFTVSVSVGLIFGYYPARRAAAIPPIEALRYE
ncbi:MAG: ABC transporter permease [Candidatus Eisenbacteria bacterium]|jgi:putative ABC transport system permease protein|nr:ABC transporter permease [Candidatus Eisenbacteria bacterium]